MVDQRLQYEHEPDETGPPVILARHQEPTLATARNRPTPLLRLPPLVRQRIYLYIGLASWDRGPYIFDLHGPARESSNPWDLWRPNPSTFHGLLLSCRAIHTEAAALLYSANRFVVCCTGPGSFTPLLALTPLALSSLAALKIILNQASCHHRRRCLDNDRDCCLYPRSVRLPCEPFKYHHRKHQFPLLSPTPESRGDDDSVDPLAATQALLDEWHSTARYLSSSVIPSRLELSLVCDIDPGHDKAVDLANSVLEPLRLFPTLRSCHIRLGKTPDPRLNQVAQDAVLRRRGIVAPYWKPPAAKLRVSFVTLPCELRLRILEFTNVVTPSKEVWWSRHHQRYSWSDIGAGTMCLKETWSCQFSECWYRSGTLARIGTGLSIGCFCRRRHAAFSDTCTCWAPPTALFLVCRALCQDAQLVFFSTNRFIIYDFKSFPPWELQNTSLDSNDLAYDYPYDRLAASQFLRDVIPAHCLAHLRFLELVFPPYFPRNWPPTDHQAMRHWRETVAWLRDKINGPALTLRVVAAEFGDWTPDHYIETITAEEGDVIHRAHIDLLQPLKQLAQGPDDLRLAAFYADLPYPWQWTEDATHRLEEEDGQAWLQGRKRVVKESAERLVLGDCRYGGQYADGKEEPGQSLWKHVVYDHA
ncbi:hypothetical protein N658DRAFT_430225 [Parathielavia hyrcaniae]|uniref:Uncharacterized protein n=1 Tax=Parathielavia hyrcaniae TaxID=113614 RepID=A0AAN6Q1J2_9PEZI|nr:hypothetical protein N658DRAFT_430225 [Parathielavia hyrcaniae]